MPKTFFYILLSAFSLFFTQAYAQKQSKKKKSTKQKTAELIVVYQKKKPVYKFTREEYLRFRDSINFKTNDDLHKVNDHKIEWRPSKIPFKAITSFPPVVTEKDPGETEADLVNIYNNNRLIRSIGPNAYRRFKDSIATKTKDTIFAISDMRVEIHSYQPPLKNVKTVRNAVFVNAKGYVTIQLPVTDNHQYRVVFFADETELFQIHSVKETQLILDKTNFVHAGWFSYEVYEDERLKEKGKLFLPKG